MLQFRRATKPDSSQYSVQEVVSAPASVQSQTDEVVHHIDQ